MFDLRGALFFYFRSEDRVPTVHPLRAITARTDVALRSSSGEIDGQYSAVGRPSIAPGRRLKGQLLITAYSIRSDHALCGQLDYNVQRRWLLDLALDEPGRDRRIIKLLKKLSPRLYPAGLLSRPTASSAAFDDRLSPPTRAETKRVRSVSP
jgi:hypothetical protein